MHAACSHNIYNSIDVYRMRRFMHVMELRVPFEYSFVNHWRCLFMYTQPEGSYDTYDAELDVDELIDFATDNERISYVKVY